MERFRVILALDTPEALAQARERIEQSCQPLTVAAAVTDPEDALAALAGNSADILIVDLQLPGPGGLELAAQVREAEADLSILLLGSTLTGEMMRRALRLGLADCLRKPVRAAEFSAALKRMVRALQQRRRAREQTLLLQAFLSGPLNTSVPPYFAESRFSIFSICLGNLCTSSAQADCAQQRGALLDGVNWEVLFEDASYEDVHFIMLRERLENQRLLLCTLPHGSQFACAAFAVQLRRFIESETCHSYPVTVAVSDASTGYGSIAAAVERTRALLLCQLRPCVSGAYLPDARQLSEPDGPVSPADQKVLTAFVQSGKHPETEEYLGCLLDRWSQSNITQQRLESGLVSLAHTLCRARGLEYCPAEDCAVLLRSVAEATELQLLLPVLTRHLSALAFHKQDGQTAPEKLCAGIKAFLDRSYESSITGTILAEQFGCHPQYISRIFHELEGQTISQYVANMRISRAKELIAAHPQLKLIQVANAVGYADYSYFSKIFQRFGGMTPAKYRVTLT